MDFKLYKGAWLYSKAPHKSFYLSENICNDLLKRGGFLVRNAYDFDTTEETSFWYVIKDSFEGIEGLSSKVRNQIRRAKNTLNIGIIDKDRMLNEGYEVDCSAIKNYKVKSELPSKESFINRINSCGDDYQFWGCIDKKTGDLVAFAINHIFDNQCSYETLKARPDYLTGYYPFYGLIYEMNRYYLDEMKLLYVCDGARSITEHSNIQPFLIQKFKFRKAYCRLQIEYLWWMKAIIKFLYPIRRFVFINKIKAVLNMESMRRGEI